MTIKWKIKQSNSGRTSQGKSRRITGRKYNAVLLIDDQCMNCHSLTAKEPFYAFIPVIGHMVGKDMKIGLRSLRMDETIAKLKSGMPVSESVLAKVEQRGNIDCY